MHDLHKESGSGSNLPKPFINLINGQKFKFTTKLDTDKHTLKDPMPWGRGPHYYIPGSFEVDIDNLSLCSGNGTSTSASEEAFANLVSGILDSFPEGHSARKIIVQVFIGVISNSSSANRFLYDNSEWKCKIHVHNQLVRKLPEECKIRVNLDNVSCNANADRCTIELGNLKSSEFAELESTFEDPPAFLYSDAECNFTSYNWCKGELGIITHDRYTNWMSSKIPNALQERTFEGKVQVLLEAHKPLENMFNLNPNTGLLSMNKLMLEQRLHCDLTILCGSGETVLAHKAMVAASSPVFRNMLDTKKWKHTNDANLTLEEMTKDGVEALLAYIYCWDQSRALECPDIATQLLVAGNKYLIETLEERMIRLLLIQPESWFNDLDSLFQLYIFTAKIGICATLQRKVERILQRFSGKSDICLTSCIDEE